MRKVKRKDEKMYKTFILLKNIYAYIFNVKVVLMCYMIEQECFSV